jgi:hypothetical protein
MPNHTALAFTNNDRGLILSLEGAEDVGEIQHWDLSPEGWIAAACRTAGRALTEEEGRIYLDSRPPSDCP